MYGFVCEVLLHLLIVTVGLYMNCNGLPIICKHQTLSMVVYTVLRTMCVSEVHCEIAKCVRDQFGPPES